MTFLKIGLPSVPPKTIPVVPPTTPSTGGSDASGPSGDSSGPIKDPGGLDSGFEEGYSGSGGHDCPAGQHWDSVKMTCVDDIQVGNKPDGHDYQIQKASNVSGLDFTTVHQFDNATDANETYNSLSPDGFWQMLVDGVMTKTNLPMSERYEATQKKKDEEYLKTIFSIEAHVQGGWAWLADYDNLADAKLGIIEFRAGRNSASIPGSDDLRIVNKLGEVVYTDKGEKLQTIFFNVEQSPTTDKSRWILRSGPYDTYEHAKATFAEILKVEPIDILRIVDTTGRVYDTYSPSTGAETGPMAGMGGLLIGLALVVALAGMKAVME